MNHIARMRVEYIYDSESRNWCFRVPSLGIIGGADTRSEAARAAIAAIQFTLEDDEQLAPTDGEVDYIEIALSGVA